MGCAFLTISFSSSVSFISHNEIQVRHKSRTGWMEKPNVTGEGMDESKGCVCVLVMRVEAPRACYITRERPQKKTQQPDR
jgi:hypothetical protein